jgi:hypothetical protein
MNKNLEQSSAYELADLIDSEDTLWLEDRLSDIRNMLRQQADRIVELEKQSEPVMATFISPLDGKVINTTPQTKPEGYGKAVPLSDEEIMKAYYRSDLRLPSGVIKFVRELRGEK